MYLWNFVTIVKIEVRVYFQNEKICIMEKDELFFHPPQQRHHIIGREKSSLNILTDHTEQNSWPNQVDSHCRLYDLRSVKLFSKNPCHQEANVCFLYVKGTQAKGGNHTANRISQSRKRQSKNRTKDRSS